MREIEKKFDEISKKYNEQRRKLIPCFDDFYGVTVSIASTGTENPSILDVGAGTGLLSAFLQQKYPTAKFTLIDLSSKMLEMARERFKGMQNVKYIIDDYVKHEFNEQYDMVVSALSIHHLEDLKKVEFYKKCFSILKPGGVLINADQTKGETEFIDKLDKQIWYKSIETSGLPQEEIQAAFDRMKLDKEATLEQQLGWLREVGFSDVNCLYKYYHFAVMFGRRI